MGNGQRIVLPLNGKIKTSPAIENMLKGPVNTIFSNTKLGVKIHHMFMDITRREIYH